MYDLLSLLPFDQVNIDHYLGFDPMIRVDTSSLEYLPFSECSDGISFSGYDVTSRIERVIRMSNARVLFATLPFRSLTDADFILTHWPGQSLSLSYSDWDIEDDPRERRYRYDDITDPGDCENEDHLEVEGFKGFGVRVSCTHWGIEVTRDDVSLGGHHFDACVFIHAILKNLSDGFLITVKRGSLGWVCIMARIRDYADMMTRRMLTVGSYNEDSSMRFSLVCKVASSWLNVLDSRGDDDVKIAFEGHGRNPTGSKEYFSKHTIDVLSVVDNDYVVDAVHYIMGGLET